MKCKICAREIPDNSLFCCWCGEKQQKERRRKADIRIPAARQLKSGAWNIELRAEKQSITEPTKALCEAKARAVRAGFIELQKKPESITLTKAIDKYIASKDAVLSPSTIAGYRVIQRNRFKVLMNKRVGDISDGVAQAAVNDELKSGKSAKTVRNAWGFINTVIKDATGKHLNVACARVVPHEQEWLTPEQILEFCELIKGQPVELGALIALHSLRNSEIDALTWDNIDLERRMIYVRGAVVRSADCKLVYKEANKTASSRRDIPIMIPRLYDLLSKDPDKSGKVLKNSAYGRLRKRIKAVCGKNGLPSCGTHSLRHSFASLCASLSIPIHVTKKLGGWSNTKILEDIYTHVAPSDILKGCAAITDFYNLRTDSEHL